MEAEEHPSHRREPDSDSREVCPRCGGTGMVCGHPPEILPGQCCVDFHTAVCPRCRGAGRKPPS